MHPVLLALTFAALDSVQVCVEDAVTHVAVRGVHARLLPGGLHDSSSFVFASGCARLPVGMVRFRRVGYYPREVRVEPVPVESPASTQVPARRVELWPLSVTPSEAASLLTTVRVSGVASDQAVARFSSSTDVRVARDMGIANTADLLGTLPFTSVRSARGEAGVSLRGARREQVVITLDGMPLNDPATGMADVSDIPLVALGSASVQLGADPLGAGVGANGGVIALESAPQRVLAIRAGAFGRRMIEGAWHAQGLGALWNASASHRRATNDFPFWNDAGASGSIVRERRVNNDEQRNAVTFGVTTAATQLSVIGSVGERGMVGAANVRTNDADRAHTSRLMLRAQRTGSRVQALAGVRSFALQYRDPNRSALDATARAVAGEAEVSGRVGVMQWRVGGGADRVLASGGIMQSRGRLFANSVYARRFAGGSVNAGVRVDAVGTLGALPSFSMSAERAVRARGESGLTVGARLAQAVRVPTLYDLYFSSPQRLFVRTLRPERVAVDAELLTRYVHPVGGGRLTLQGSAVARDTRDAIIWFPGNFGWSPANVGVERLRGFEARAHLSAGRSEFSVWGTRYDATLTTGALRIPTPYVARMAGGAQLRASVGATTLSAQLHATGRRPYTAGPRTPDFELPAVLLADVAVARRVSTTIADLLVALSLDNVGDARWQSVRGFPSPGRSWAFSTTVQHRAPK